MALDQTTEIVSHFIGVFQMTLEDTRMKDAYAAFRAMRDEAAQFGDLLNINVNFTGAYHLKKFLPVVDYAPNFWPLASLALAGPMAFPLIPVGFPITSTFIARATTQPTMSVDVPAPIPFGQMGPASSIVTITYQSNTLMDGDVIYVMSATPMQVWSNDTDQIDDAIVVVEELTPIEVSNPIEMEGDAHDFALEVYDAVVGAEIPDIEGVTVVLLKGEDAQGEVIINGEISDEMPEVSDVLPAFLQKDTDEEQSESEEDADDSTEIDEDASSFTLSDEPSTDDKEEDNPWSVGEGHQITTGANLLVNEAAILNSWLDAPLIAVLGDAISVESISQINILVETDEDETLGLPGQNDPVSSTAINAASSIETSSSIASAEGTSGGGMPTNWFVSRMEGDLVVMNWIEQSNFLLDNENVQVELSGWHTNLSLGENSLVNFAAFKEIGFGYDMIIVGGNMIDITTISQTNILIDNDLVTFGDIAPDSVSTADNLVMNKAIITTNGIDTTTDLSGPIEDAAKALEADATMLPGTLGLSGQFDGLDTVRILYIEGDFVSINSIEQRNVLGDSDQVQMVLDDFVNEAGGKVTVTTGSNALMNIATVATYGVDSEVHVGGEVYSDAMLYQAELIDTSADPTGVGLTALANEAVAFLAEGLIEDDVSLGEELMIGEMTDGGGLTPDSLTLMLA